MNHTSPPPPGTHSALRSWWRAGYLAPWFGGYSMVGLVVSGIVPVLLPLSVTAKGPIAVGLVVAGFYLGMLMAPFFGSVADRTGTQRLVFLASFPTAAAGSVLFAFAGMTWAMFLCMLLVGASAGAAQTTASMFIVEGRPKQEWPSRMGWLRLAFGAGQVLGLGVAIFFAHQLETGWIVVGVLMLVGTFLGWIHLPRIAHTPPAPEPGETRRARIDADLRSLLLSRFGVFLGCWLFAMIGLMTFYNVVPLILHETFDIDPSTTSLVFLIGSAIGAVLYPVCGTLARRWGSARVLGIGIVGTLCAFLVLSLATFERGEVGAVLGSLCLVTIASLYPAQYMGATLLAADIAPGGEGAAMGLFNSGVAAGAIIGAIVPSLLAQQAGYSSVAWFSLGALVASVAFGLPLLRSLRHSPAPGT
ncbi:MFS transporter [Gordonia alkaliphila]|uniref:MFS transporter n=1 Tax=Gordonia alkaliphila TaxID=1053547 RepID=UPI001FF5B1CB|nr:MFS transporter [Gordonia alkaliphila]MCK0437959.1 MFS transporter [Gordonia alkaliphila]